LFITDVPLNRDWFEAAARQDYGRFPSLEEMACLHANLIAEADCPGPLIIAGCSCWGGALHLETAHQLHARGLPVEGICLLDTMISSTSSKWLAKWCAIQARNALDTGLPYLWNKARTVLQNRTENLLRRLPHTPEALPSNHEDALQTDAAWQYELSRRIWHHARKKYKPRPFAGKGILIRAVENPYSELQDFDGCLGWSRLFSKGLTVVKTPGNYYSMWKEPHLLQLSLNWQQALHSQTAGALTSFDVQTQRAKPEAAAAIELAQV
jgi:acetoacetyl-CoA synthetase